MKKVKVIQKFIDKSHTPTYQVEDVVSFDSERADDLIEKKLVVEYFTAKEIEAKAKDEAKKKAKAEAEKEEADKAKK